MNFQILRFEILINFQQVSIFQMLSILRFQIPTLKSSHLDGCIAFTRDGGPEVAGKFIGVAGRLKSAVAKANGTLIDIHCINHRLELEIKVFRENPIVKHVIQILQRAMAWFNAHSSRRLGLEEICAENNRQYYALKNLYRFKMDVKFL